MYHLILRLCACLGVISTWGYCGSSPQGRGSFANMESFIFGCASLLDIWNRLDSNQQYALNRAVPYRPACIPAGARKGAASYGHGLYYKERRRQKHCCECFGGQSRNRTGSLPECLGCVYLKHLLPVWSRSPGSNAIDPPRHYSGRLLNCGESGIEPPFSWTHPTRRRRNKGKDVIQAPGIALRLPSTKGRDCHGCCR